MLPDLPELKNDLNSLLMDYVKAQVKLRMPGLNEVPQHIIHEGMRMRILRADGSVDDSQLKLASSEILIGADEVPVMGPKERTSKLDSLAEDMARQISQHAFASLNETLDQAGQVVNQGRRPLDADGILAMFDKMQIDFDEHGSPKNISVIVGPNTFASAKKEFERLSSEPELRARHEELMQKKWMEWRDREATRKLVG
ncbi:hypothetical protein GALL_35210 [mine drainage metagenome]|uniref:Uncharacterized protein n=1 Tax=mine drainage metagenome TaxID=410659 RepID=A0A1J5T562_9ZZZZ